MRILATSNNSYDARGAAVTGGAPSAYHRDTRPPRLSKRLAAVADAVSPGARVADVGCDHGKLAAYLVCSGKCPGVVASDINEPPLDKARELFGSLGISERCRAVLCDGLDGVEPHEVDDIVIAGVGGDVVIGILARAAWLREGDIRLVLCPTTRRAKLRRWLYGEGFELTGERAVAEDGFCYTVMSARYSGDRREITSGFAAIGLLTGDSDDEKAYRAREIKRAERLLRSGADESKKKQAQNTLDYICEVDK